MDDSENEEFFAEQGRILQRLANALIEATPEWWTEATLKLELNDEGWVHVISSAIYPQDLVTPTNEIFEQTFALRDLFDSKLQSFKSVLFRVARADRDGEELWKSSADYTY